MHKNSPQTHIIVTQMIFKSHQESVDGKEPLYDQHNIRCMRCAVTVKSKHSFVLCTKYHKASDLQHTKTPELVGKKFKYLKIYCAK